MFITCQAASPSCASTNQSKQRRTENVFQIIALCRRYGRWSIRIQYMSTTVTWRINSYWWVFWLRAAPSSRTIISSSSIPDDTHYLFPHWLHQSGGRNKSCQVFWVFIDVRYLQWQWVCKTPYRGAIISVAMWWWIHTFIISRNPVQSGRINFLIILIFLTSLSKMHLAKAELKYWTAPNPWCYENVNWFSYFYSYIRT